MRKKVENKSVESELAAKECCIKQLEGRERDHKRAIEELNNEIRLLTNEKTTLEARLRNQLSSEEFRMKFSEQNKANEELSQKREEIIILQDDLTNVKAQASKYQERIYNLQLELTDKESCLREESGMSKQKTCEQDRLISKLKEENQNLLDKSKSLDKQCSEQRKELDNANIEMKEMRSTLIAALENANKTEDLRKVEMEHGQHSMTALEKRIDNGTNNNNKELSDIIPVFKSALADILENSQAYKEISCSVSESFQQLMNKDSPLMEKAQTLSISEQHDFAKQLFTMIFTEIKLLSHKVIDAENKIIKLNTQNFGNENKNLSQTSQLKGFKQKLQNASRNASISIASSFLLDKENFTQEIKYAPKGMNSQETSLGDLITDGHSDHIITEDSSLKNSLDRSPCQSICENNSKFLILFNSI